VGDTVWYDGNGNGVQDTGEAGISGVVLELLTDLDSAPVQTVVTGDTSNPNWAACVVNNTGLDTQGLYCFGVDDPGTYVVRVAASNFQPGGALAGLASTTGGETQTDSVVDDNVLTYDFGYRGTASVGDRVWQDNDGGADQDGGEPGINGVTVELLDAGGNVIATQVTSGDGNYLFANLTPGNYSVRVVSSTLPAGLTQTYDLDGTGTPHVATFPLGPGQNRTDVDFGYRPPQQQPGTGTLGYWKNHPEAWPVEQITVGGTTWSKSQAISLLSTPSRGDKSIDLFKQLVPAKLNVLIGNDSSCISSTISAADAWLVSNPVGSGVRSSSAAWATGGPLHQTLDDYNNGRLCAPHRD
jgi:hypothetical protein